MTAAEMQLLKPSQAEVLLAADCGVLKVTRESDRDVYVLAGEKVPLGTATVISTLQRKGMLSGADVTDYGKRAVLTVGPWWVCSQSEGLEAGPFDTAAEALRFARECVDSRNAAPNMVSPGVWTVDGRELENYETRWVLTEPGARKQNVTHLLEDRED